MNENNITTMNLVSAFDSFSHLSTIMGVILFVFAMIKILNSISRGEGFSQSLTFIFASVVIFSFPNIINTMTEDVFKEKSNNSTPIVVNENKKETKPANQPLVDSVKNESANVFVLLKYLLYTILSALLFGTIYFLFIYLRSFIMYKLITNKINNLVDNTNSFNEIVENILTIEKIISKTSEIIKKDSFFKDKIIEASEKLKNKKIDLDLILNKEEELILMVNK